MASWSRQLETDDLGVLDVLTWMWSKAGKLIQLFERGRKQLPRKEIGK